MEWIDCVNLCSDTRSDTVTALQNFSIIYKIINISILKIYDLDHLVSHIYLPIVERVGEQSPQPFPIQETIFRLTLESQLHREYIVGVKIIYHAVGIINANG